MKLDLQALATRKFANDSALKGLHASPVVTFGEFNRYAIFAVHTRFDRVQWFVQDAERPEKRTGLPTVIAQAEYLPDLFARFAAEMEVEA